MAESPFRTNIRIPARPSIPNLAVDPCAAAFDTFRYVNRADISEGAPMLSAFIASSPECAAWARRQMPSAPSPTTAMQCASVWDGWISQHSEYTSRAAALIAFAAANPSCAAWARTELAALARIPGLGGRQTTRIGDGTVTAGLMFGVPMLAFGALAVGLLALIQFQPARKRKY